MKIQGTYRIKPHFVWLFLIVIATLAMSTASLRAEGTWAQKADMPTARSFAAAAVVDGIIYVIGGSRVGLNSMISDVEAYDPETDTWEEKANMPTPRANLSVAVVDGKIYAIGGERANGVFATGVEVYDVVTDEWIKKGNLSTLRSGCAADVIDGIIYVIGGFAGAPGAWKILRTVEAYDPAADKWTEKADMPTGRYTRGAAVDGTIYVIGGAGGPFGPPYSQAVEAYNPVADSWTKKSDMPAWVESWTFGTAPVVNGRIYLTGSAGQTRSYDPTTDTWADEPDLLTPRHASTAAVVNGRIYVFGGGIGEGSPGLPTVEEFTPAGWPFPKSAAVSPQGKLPTLWGALKAWK